MSVSGLSETLDSRTLCNKFNSNCLCKIREFSDVTINKKDSYYLLGPTLVCQIDIIEITRVSIVYKS